MGLTLTALGTGDAFSALHYSASLVLECEGRMLLIDCPHPIRKMLKEGFDSSKQPLDESKIEACVLTHLHGDHASGLEGWGFFNHFAFGRRAKLVTHPLVREDLWNGHLRAGMKQLIRKLGEPAVPCSLGDFFEYLPIYESHPVVVGPFTIECRRTLHHIPTIATKVRAGGKVFGYSADTAFDEQLVDWLSEADLIIHETNLGGAHTPYESLRQLPEPIRNKMKLIAFPDGMTFDGAIGILEQGSRLSL